jgi:hypothetical protein
MTAIATGFRPPLPAGYRKTTVYNEKMSDGTFHLGEDWPTGRPVAPSLRGRTAKSFSQAEQPDTGSSSSLSAHYRTTRR